MKFALLSVIPIPIIITLVACKEPEPISIPLENKTFSAQRSYFHTPHVKRSSILSNPFGHVLEIEEEVEGHHYAKPTTVILSHSSSDVPYIDLATNNHIEYAKKHGYDYIFRSDIISADFIDDSARKPVYRLGLFWQKIQAVLEALELKDGNNYRYQTVMWIDADALFTNFSKAIEDFTEQYPNKGLLISTEHRSHLRGLSIVNSGIFIIQNTTESRRRWREIRRLFGLYKHNICPEQDAIQDYILKYVDPNRPYEIVASKYRAYNIDDTLNWAKILPARDLNAWYKMDDQDAGWYPGDYIAHMAYIPHSGHFGNDKATAMQSLWSMTDETN